MDLGASKPTELKRNVYKFLIYLICGVHAYETERKYGGDIMSHWNSV